MDFSKDTKLDKVVLPVQRALSYNSDTSSEATAMSEDKPEFQWLLLWKVDSYFGEATLDKIDGESTSGTEGDLNIKECSVDEEPQPCPYNFPRGASKWHPGHKRHCDCLQCYPEGAYIDAESGSDVEDEEDCEEESEEESDVEEDSEEDVGEDSEENVEEDDEDVDDEDVEEEDIEDDLEEQYVEAPFEEVYERVPLFDELGKDFVEAETLEVKEPEAKRMKFSSEEVSLADFLPEKFLPEHMRSAAAVEQPRSAQPYEGHDESLLYEGLSFAFHTRF